jgi:hypothetical protein
MAALRTEFRSQGATLPLTGDPRQWTPLLHQFERSGFGGELLVIDERTGRIVIRQAVGHEPEEGDIVQPLPPH